MVNALLLYSIPVHEQKSPEWNVLYHERRTLNCLRLRFFIFSGILFTSTPFQDPCGYSSVVEHLVAIENVARSTRVTRF
jgi:hypothetical protein